MNVKAYLKSRGYQLLRQIGKGAFATVFKARRLDDQLDVAIKAIPVGGLSPAQLQNCLDEVRITCRIDHPSIVKYFESFYDAHAQLLFIVMEYLAGGDLARHIRRIKNAQEQFSEQTIWRFVLQAFSGLAKLHQMSVLHRDIKPANLFLTKDFKNIKIGDLNACKINMHNRLSRTVIGTPNYLAPEIWQKRGYDHRCDVFSLGCVIYEIASLEPTFPGKSLDALSAKIRKGLYKPLSSTYSKELKVLISCSLIQDFRQRPSVDELLKSKVVREKLKLFPELQLARENTKSLNWSTMKSPSNLNDFKEILEDIHQKSFIRSKTEAGKTGRAELALKKNWNGSGDYRRSSTIQVLDSNKKYRANFRKMQAEEKGKINIYDDTDEDEQNVFFGNRSQKYGKLVKSKTERKAKSEFQKIGSKKSRMKIFENEPNWDNRPHRKAQNRRLKPNSNLFSNMNAKIKSLLAKKQTMLDTKSIKSFGEIKASNSPDKAVIYNNLYQQQLAKSRSRNRSRRSPKSKSRKQRKMHLIFDQNQNAQNYPSKNRDQEGQRESKWEQAQKSGSEWENGKQAMNRKRKPKKLPLPMFGQKINQTNYLNGTGGGLQIETGFQARNGFSFPSPSERKQVNNLFINQYQNQRENEQFSLSKEIFEVISRSLAEKFEFVC